MRRQSLKKLIRPAFALALIAPLGGCSDLLTSLADAMLVASPGFTSGGSGSTIDTSLLNNGPQYGPVQSYYDSTMTSMMWNH